LKLDLGGGGPSVEPAFLLLRKLVKGSFMKTIVSLIRILVLFLGLSPLAQAKIQLVEQTGYKLSLRFTEADATALKDLIQDSSIKASKEDFSTIRQIICGPTTCDVQLHGELRETTASEFQLIAPPESSDETATHTDADGALLQILVDASYKNKSIKMRKSKRGDITASTLHIPIMEAEAKLGSLTFQCGNRLGLWTKPFILQSSCTVQGSVSK
jgi:hypothetical protein